MITIKNVLVATDFSDSSAAALDYGREFARSFGARLHVLHVVADAFMYVGPEMVSVNLPQIQADLEEAARKQLDALVTPEDRSQLRAVNVARPGAAPAFQIAAYAKEANIDLIITGTHGRGAISHLLMGSVAEKIVRIAPCPVLTVKHPEHEFLMPDAMQLAKKARQQ